MERIELLRTGCECCGLVREGWVSEEYALMMAELRSGLAIASLVRAVDG